MTSNLRQLVDRLDLLEEVTNLPVFWYKNDIVLLNGFTDVFDSLATNIGFERVITAANATISIHDPKTLELFDDFKDQTEFFYNYVQDIRAYLSSHRIEITDEEYDKLENLRHKRADTISYRYKDPIGIKDTSKRGLLLATWNNELNVVLHILKAHGVEI